MILTVCMSPCTDITIEVDSLSIGMTNIVKSKSVACGGKGLNVATGVARLGEEVFTTGVMYSENGYMFENALKKENIPYAFVWNQGSARENYKFIDNRAMLTEVNDVGDEISQDKAEETLALIHQLSQKSQVTVLSGGLPRGIQPDFYGKMVEAVAPTSKIIVDASSGRLFSAIKKGVDLVKPNLEELEHTLGRKIESKEDMLEGCYELISLGAKTVVLSLGKQGAILTDGKKNYYCKSMNVAVNSTVGAGDGMVSAMAVKLAENAPLFEILRSGVAAGTATVMTTGKTSFTKEKYNEVLATLRVSEI